MRGLMHLLILGAVALSVSSQEACSSYACCQTATLTAYSVQQYPEAMRNGLPTGPHVGTAVAVGVDRRGVPLLPLGTVVWIEGVGERTVMDTGLGGAGWFDVLMSTTAEARQFGRQSRTVCQ